MRWTEADLARHRHNGSPIAAPAAVERRGRNSNRKAEYQGQVFDSKHELEVFKEFELERAAGKIRAVVRQVSMPIAGSKRRIRLDFMIVENDGRIRFIDAKGYAEREWCLKRDLVQSLYGITIETC
jgi:Protein of unknown function (DUF1064)